MTVQTASHRRDLARRIIIDLAAMTLIGVFLAIIGPFGSIAAPLPERLVTWTGFAWLGYACYRPMQSIAIWGERELALPRWGVLAAAILVGTVPMTFAVLAVNSLPSGELRWPSFEVLAGTYFSALVLMRMRDAVALLGDLEGMQVHRSWWVARGAVEDVLREGRNVRLSLARGIEAPVARANITALRDARWI